MSVPDIRRAQLEKLRREHHDLRMQLQQLNAKMHAKIRAKEEEMSRLAPVYTLPEDAVVLILKTAYQHHFPHCHLDDGLPRTRSPLAISHTSRWWRGHALSVPHIWTCIHVTYDQPPTYDKVIKAYLVRSRNIPISIFYLNYSTSLRQSMEGWQFSQAAAWPRFKMCWEHILADAHRWKHCALYTNEEDTAAMIMRDLKDKTFPQLEYFGFSLNGYFGSPRKRLPRFEAPKLTHLRIDYRLDISQSPEQLFTHLTELKISKARADTEGFMGLLRQAADTLQTLTLVSVQFYGAGILTTTIPELAITLPRLACLTCLTISHIPEGTADLPNIHKVMCCTAPALLDLTIDVSLDVLTSDFGLVLPNVRRLNCESELPGTRASVLALPSLRTLETARPSWSSVIEVLQLATRLDTSSEMGCIAWPELKTLVIPPLRDRDSIAGLAQFVEHRARVGCPLQTIGITRTDVGGDMAVSLDQPNIPWPNVIKGFDGIDWNGLKTFWDCSSDKPTFLAWGRSISYED